MSSYSTSIRHGLEFAKLSCTQGSATASLNHTETSQYEGPVDPDEMDTEGDSDRVPSDLLQ